ncbi:MAG TPA: AAA family ATPase [Thermodesulfobacteriota bacterium]
MKIKNIEIKALRGIRENLNLSLDKAKSILLYGDNGSGKSSITDSLEWFYTGRVEHLSREEIGTGGINALRNIFLPEDEDAYINLEFSDSNLNSLKKLSLQRSKLSSEYSNETSKFNDYLEASQKENLILRYKDLLRFILSTKTEKLNEISQIIGFSEVTRIKDVFKKTVNSLKNELKIKNFESHINNKQAQILNEIGQNINNDDQYFSAIKESIKPLELSIDVKDDQSIDSILELIKKPGDDESLRLTISYDNVIEPLSNLKSYVKDIASSYTNYYEKYQGIFKDLEKFKRISLEKLLSEGLRLLKNRIFEVDKCPLCLQGKNREQLINELKERIEELSTFKKEKENLEEVRHTTLTIIQNASPKFETTLKEKCLSIEDNLQIKNEVEEIKKILENCSESLKEDPLITLKEIKKPEDHIKINLETAQQIISILKEKKEKIVTAKKDDLKFSINSKLITVRQAYKEIKSLKKEFDLHKQQVQSMELIYNEFVKKQREGLLSFLNAISKDINELYLYMNPSEDVDEIEIIPLDKDDDFVGITIQHKFHGEIVSPPDKYLSESHLNCLGICLFLSSVKAFNKVNKFFVLDDVISSFDKTHRLRFANLLVEKFSDYQIFVFTHEKDWFDYFANIVKGKNWFINKIVWDSEKGVDLEIPLIELKERIDKKLEKSDESDLGNMMRKYLERHLKEISFNTKVKMEFLYNDKNEDRMSYEMLSELRSTVKKRKCPIKDEEVLNRLSASSFIGSKTSHYSSYKDNISDLKVFYDDINELASLFECGDCNRYISEEYYDTVGRKIRCRCGIKSYEWQKH